MYEHQPGTRINVYGIITPQRDVLRRIGRNGLGATTDTPGGWANVDGYGPGSEVGGDMIVSR